MQIKDNNFLDPARINLMSWNVQKQSCSNLLPEFKHLSQGVDLALLQEVHLENQPRLNADQDWHHCFAPGFVMPGMTTGVMTLSASKYDMHQGHRIREPVLRTAKATNVSTYSMLGKAQNLLVINIHAVNFSLGMKSYRSQLQQVQPLLESHRGPVIFAGDFNTWHDDRIEYLKLFTRKYNLDEVLFQEDSRSHCFGRHLDYVFVKNLGVESATTVKTKASDHNPMLVKLVH